jgi:hypothetical protein
MSDRYNGIKTNTELAQAMRQGIFSKRETIKEAYEYAGEIALSLRPEDRMPMLTAIGVLMNTLANKIEELDLKEM